MADNDNLPTGLQLCHSMVILSRLLDAFVITSEDGVPPADDLN